MEFDEFKENLPEMLGDDYYNDPETREQPTKYFDNVDSFETLAKRAVNADRKISAQGEELKKATEGMVRIPGEGATEEDIAAYRKATGVPETNEGYELNVPEGEGFPEIAKIVCEAANKANIPKSKLAAVWEPVVTALIAQNQALEKKGMKLLAEDVQALKDAKKEKYDSFIAYTNRVAAHFDVKADPANGIEENLIGSNFMKLMDTMGIKDIPVIREFLGAIAPLVLEGKTKIGAGASKEGGGDWFTDYDELDEI